MSATATTGTMTATAIRPGGESPDPFDDSAPGVASAAAFDVVGLDIREEGLLLLGLGLATGAGWVEVNTTVVGPPALSLFG